MDSKGTDDRCRGKCTREMSRQWIRPYRPLTAYWWGALGAVTPSYPMEAYQGKWGLGYKFYTKTLYRISHPLGL